MDEHIESSTHELKTPTKYLEQIEKLRVHNVQIDNSGEVKSLLEHVNYYRLNGYMLQWRENDDSGKLDPNHHVTFNQIKQIYEFDNELRDLLLRYLGIIEIYFRSLVSYETSNIMCKDSHHDQHYKYAKYPEGKREEAKRIIEKTSQKIETYKETAIVRHHKEKYNGKYPLWVLVEMMSFSDLSKYYSCLPVHVKKSISVRLGQSLRAIERDMESLSVLRNCCAHVGRLYNKRLIPAPYYELSFLKGRPYFDKGSIFSFVLCAVKYLPTNSCAFDFIQEFEALVEKYGTVIDKSIVGITYNYLDLLADNAKTKDQLLTDNLNYRVDIGKRKAENDARMEYWVRRKNLIANVLHLTISFILFIALARIIMIADLIKNHGTIAIIGLMVTFAVLVLTDLLGNLLRWLKKQSDKAATRIIKWFMPPQDAKKLR